MRGAGRLEGVGWRGLCFGRRGEVLAPSPMNNKSHYGWVAALRDKGRPFAPLAFDTKDKSRAEGSDAC